MKTRVILVILAVSLLLNPLAALAEEDDIVSISFSSQLHIGDSFTWQINNVSSISGFAPNDTITFEIMGETDVNIYKRNVLFSIFKITVNNDTFTLEWNDIIYWFICPINITYANGNQVNAAENMWIDLVYYDFYSTDSPYSAYSVRDLVTYSGTLDYEDGSFGYFDGVVNRETGIVQSLAISFIDADGVVDEYIDLKLLNADEGQTLAFLPLNPLPFVFSIAILAIVIRKRKI